MLVWLPEFAVGNDQIDADHREMLSLLNKIEQAFACGFPLAIIRIFLTELFEFTECHYEREEQIQRMIPLQKSVGHVNKHAIPHAIPKEQLRIICGQIEALAGKPHRGSNSVEIVAELNRDWLTPHLLDEDMQMRRYLLLHQFTAEATRLPTAAG